MDDDEIPPELRKYLDEPGYFYKRFLEELERLGVSERMLAEVADLTRETFASYRGKALDYKRGVNHALPHSKKLGRFVASKAFRDFPSIFKANLVRLWLTQTVETGCNAADINQKTIRVITKLIELSPRNALEEALKEFFKD